MNLEERNNLASKYPEIAERLRSKVERWSNEMKPPGLSPSPLSLAGKNYFDHDLDGKNVTAIPDQESDEPTVKKPRKKR